VGASQPSHEKPPPLPSPGEIRRRVSFYPKQAVGIALLFLVPLLAMFKLFDTSRASVQGMQGGLALEVLYPSKLRHRTYKPLVVAVANNTGKQLEKLELRLDRGYFDHFQSITFTPDVKGSDGRHFIVEFEHVNPGETRTLNVVYEVDEVGSFHGEIQASAGAGAPATVRFTTFVFP
jgi:hypothetical protein